MVLVLARVVGVGLETADMLVQEILPRPLRDRRHLGTSHLKRMAASWSRSKRRATLRGLDRNRDSVVLAQRFDHHGDIAHRSDTEGINGVECVQLVIVNFDPVRA